MSVKHLAAAALALLAMIGAQLPRSAPAAAATITLGSTAAGPLTDSYDAHHMNGSRFTTGAAGGTVTSMTVFVGPVGTAPNNSYQTAIYRDSAGAPGALVARSATGALVGDSANTIPITATLAPNTAYWLMYNTNGPDPLLNNLRYAAGGTGGWSSGTVPFGTWPAEFGASARAAFTFSIFATYETGGAPAPTVSLTAPLSGATVSGVATLTAAATNAVAVQFKLGADNLGAEDAAPPFSSSWDTTGLANGQYTLSAVARNSAGDTTASAPVTVTVQNDAAAPTVTLTAPADGAVLSGVQTVTAAAANAAAVQFKLDGADLGAEDASPPFSVSWDTTAAANGPHTLSAVARNAAGVTATATAGVTVNNAAPPPPPPPPPSTTTPILVVTHPGNPFTRYLTEILTAEGLNAYSARNLDELDAAVLNSFDVVILGEMPLSAAQATLLTSWVNGGGRLIAMRPDKRLAGLFGLADAGGTQSDTYLRIDTASAPGAGLVGETIQYHGPADRYTLNGAAALATLYANATTATAHPAVTNREVGPNGGRAVAFTYDLARSVVLTRQGNPAWAGRNVDGVDGYEASEMFFGANGDPDWNDLSKALIPIADEQQRLLANVVTLAAGARKPLPRFWYFPRDHKAVIVMTGDDHATGGTAPRFNDYLAKSPPGCNVANWECIRSSSYLFPFANTEYPTLTTAQALAYEAQGFEVGVHITTNCAPWGSPQNLADIYASQTAQFRAFWPGLRNPDSTRTHCVEWDDWSTHAKVKLANGIRFDTDYYFYPASWTRNRPGYFTGSAMVMRYADLDGSLIDVYQAATQVSDESGHDVAAAVNVMLDKAFGAEGYYTVITANEHTDSTSDTARVQSDQIIEIAKTRGVPVVSGRQMLEWLDARNSSTFSSIAWDANALSFTVNGGANGLTGMLPLAGPAGALSSISRGGSSVPFTVKAVKGVQYAFFAAAPGAYRAAYGSAAPDTTAPTVASVTPAAGAVGVPTDAVVRFEMSEVLDPASVSAASAELRTAGAAAPAAVAYDAARRTVTVTPAAALSAGTTYTATLRAGGVRDLAGNALAAASTVTFTTASVSPPPAAPLGHASIGAGTDTHLNNWLHGTRVVNGPAPRTITSLSVYARGAVSPAPNNRFRVAIYTDAGGAPGTLVASSGEGVLTANSWNSLPVSAALAADTAYWLVYNTNGVSPTANGLAYDPGPAGAGMWSTGAVAYGTWPSTFAAARVGVRYSIYAQ